MARFIKTLANGNFLGWDSLEAGSLTTEASERDDLGLPLSAEATRIFAGLEPCETFKTFDRIEYFREW